MRPNVQRGGRRRHPRLGRRAVPVHAGAHGALRGACLVALALLVLAGPGRAAEETPTRSNEVNHVSNAGFGDGNPGGNSLLLTLTIPLGAR